MADTKKLAADGKEINCRECNYGTSCNVAHAHGFRVGSCVCFSSNKTMTNADKIRQMTDEELADFIAGQRFSAVNPIADKFGIDVTTAFIVGRKNALDWLKQEVTTHEPIHPGGMA